MDLKGQLKESKAQALVYSLGNLTLLLLGRRYWMPSVYLIQYSVSSTETPGKSFLPLRRKGMEQASKREAGQGGARSLLLHGHSSVTTSSPPCHRCPSFFISSNTSSFQSHSSLRDKEFNSFFKSCTIVTRQSKNVCGNMNK